MEKLETGHKNDEWGATNLGKLIREEKTAKEEGLWLEGQRTISSYLRTVVLKKTQNPEMFGHS